MDYADDADEKSMHISFFAAQRNKVRYLLPECMYVCLSVCLSHSRVTLYTVLDIEI